MSAMLAERVASFLVDGARRTKGARWDQGARAVALPVPTGCPALAAFATRRVCGVPEVVVLGLFGWATTGRPAQVVDRIPTAAEVLGLQGRGQRFVSLLNDAAAAAHGDPRHPDGLTFALHDLCHLEKFVDPEHHVGQRGFFRACSQLNDDPPWVDIEATLDDTWRADRDYVYADMNGSAIFLFAALKMKFAMAARRARARTRGQPAPHKGALSADERRDHRPQQEALFQALGMPAALRPDAHAVSARRDAPESAARLLRYFEERGR